MSAQAQHPETFDAGRYLLRPAGPGDLSALERIAGARAIGINSLPSDSTQLLDKLERSAYAFASEDDASGEEIYLFVLVDTHDGRGVGSSGIAASAGFGLGQVLLDRPARHELHHREGDQQDAEQRRDHPRLEAEDRHDGGDDVADHQDSADQCASQSGIREADDAA